MSFIVQRLDFFSFELWDFCFASYERFDLGIVYNHWIWEVLIKGIGLIFNVAESGYVV